MASTVGIVGRRLDEALDAGGEGLVGVVDQDVAAGDGAEDVRVLGVGRLQARRGDRGQGGSCSDGRGAEVERIRSLRPSGPSTSKILGLGPQLLGEEIAHPARHPRRHLQPDDGGEAALPQLLLDRLQEILGLSSLRCTSALRVTRKGWDSTISIPGNSRSRLWAITSSSGTKRSVSGRPGASAAGCAAP